MSTASRAAVTSYRDFTVKANGPQSKLHSPGDDFYGIPNPRLGEDLRLGDLRGRLIRQEDTIIFALIERAQFRLNDAIYKPGEIPIPGKEGISFSEYLLCELEKVYARVRRYTSPDEHSFSSPEDLPKPILPTLEYPPTIREDHKLNINEQVANVYRERVLPDICERGDDQNYGSSATCDVACLQALSKRVHYGKFIAEAKYLEDPQMYLEFARNSDRNSILRALTNSKVEEQLLLRVKNKASAYGQEIDFQGAKPIYKVDPAKIAATYRDWIIPLTKDVEVEYLLKRPFIR